MIQEMFDKIKKILDDGNKKGVPIPLARDNDHASLSATFCWISFSLVVVGLVGKWSGKLGTIDVQNALQLTYACFALHFGKSWKGKNSSFSSGKDDSPSPPSSPDA
jgi:hypothetical protein